MGYPKKKINEDLKELAKHFDMDAMANILEGINKSQDKAAFDYILEVFRIKVRFLPDYMAYTYTIYGMTGGSITTTDTVRINIPFSIINNMRTYQRIIPKIDEKEIKNIT